MNKNNSCTCNNPDELLLLAPAMKSYDIILICKKCKFIGSPEINDNKLLEGVKIINE